MESNLTVLNLLTFTPQNEAEKQLFNFDRKIIDGFLSDLDKGFFYLGGQIRMKHNDLISLDTIEQVREIDRRRLAEYGGPCNTLEANSIYNHNKKLEFIENMIIKYNEIMTIREKKINENYI